MRLLAASGIFAVDNSGEESVYCLSPVSYLLVDGIPRDEQHISSHSSFVLSATSTRCVEAALGLADWLKKDAVAPPFEELHGATLFHESLERASMQSSTGCPMKAWHPTMTLGSI